MAGVPALREAVAAKIERAVRPPLRPGHRDHHHRRRHAGHPDRHPAPSCTRATRSSCSSPATTATSRTSSWPAARAGARAADAAHASGPTSTRIARRCHAAHARHHRQHAAQPERHACGRADDMQRAGRAAARHRRHRDRRRGLRAHGVRRQRARERLAPPELAARSFVVSSFGKTFHVTGWKVGYVAAPAALIGRVPQGAPVQRVHRQHADAACAWRSYMADPAPYLELPRLLPAQARPVPRRPGAHAAAAAAEPGQLLPVRGLLGRERPAARRPSAAG